MTVNLKEAKNKGNLKQFVKEHKKDPKGDKDKFDKLGGDECLPNCLSQLEFVQFSSITTRL